MHEALSSVARRLVGVEQPEATQDVAALAARFVLDHEPPPSADASEVDLPVRSASGLMLRRNRRSRDRPRRSR
jgi:hypothetical protein